MTLLLLEVFVAISFAFLSYAFKANQYTFHIEATKDAGSLIKKIKEKGMRAGIALKPETPVSAISDHLANLDMVLIMTVPPGFGGQKFSSEPLEKAKEIRTKYPNLDIGVDGGAKKEELLLFCLISLLVFNRCGIVKY